MTPLQRVRHGNRFPYDAPDSWWAGKGNRSLKPRDRFHAAARGVAAELLDRGGIQNVMEGLDEEIREEIVAKIADIIKVTCLTPRPKSRRG